LTRIREIYAQFVHEGAVQYAAMNCGANSKGDNVKNMPRRTRDAPLGQKGDGNAYTPHSCDKLVPAAIAGASPAWAKWGCAARSPVQYWSNSYNDNIKTEASTEALNGCHAAGGKECHIIGCSANINTAGEANAMWPPPNPVTGVLLPAHRGTPKGRNP
jgi:hypothetical protein